MPPLRRAGQGHAPTLALKGPAPEAALEHIICLELRVLRLSRPNALEFTSQNYSGLSAGAQGLQIGFWSRVTASGTGGEEWRSGGAGRRRDCFPPLLVPASLASYPLAGGFAPFLEGEEGRLILPLSPVLQQESLTTLPPLLFWESLLHGL